MFPMYTYIYFRCVYYVGLLWRRMQDVNAQYACIVYVT